VVSAYIGICGLVVTVVGMVITGRQNRNRLTSAGRSDLAQHTIPLSIPPVHTGSQDHGARADKASDVPATAAIVCPQEKTNVGLLTMRELVGSKQWHRKAPPVPRQLPGAPRLFTGRARELAQLTGTLDISCDSRATVVISAIRGTAGIGKTALALHWAHQNVQQFPDGQLYVNLRGFDPSESPMPSAAAVRGFLDALHVEPGAIPVDLDAQAALYRGLVTGKRMLIVLDNARDTAHVTPLLPGSPTCTVLVTSRHQLAGLVTAHGAQPLALDTLTKAEARELLTRHLGRDRIVAESEAVSDLLERCAGLPLALGIVAARALAHPRFPLAVLAEELGETVARLDALDAGELNVNLRAVFSCSYDALNVEAAKMFRLLGLAPGPDISLPALASLTALPPSRACALVRDLEVAHLVQQHTPGRYRLHDLVKLYATEQAHHVLQDSPHAPLRRLVDFYLHTAYAGDRLLAPHRRPIELDQPDTGSVFHPLANRAAALKWFNTEYPCLLTAQKVAERQGWDKTLWQLAWALANFQWRRHRHDTLTTWRSGLAAAERLADPAPQVRAHRILGQACAWADRHTEGLDHLQRALTLSEQTGDAYGQARTHYDLAWTWGRQGDHQRALTHADLALHLFQTLGNPVWQANALNSVGWYHTRLGHHQQARTSCEAALTLQRQHHNREGESETLNSLGFIAHHTGKHAQAIRYYDQALTLCQVLGDTYYEADILTRIGNAYAALGQNNDARNAWQQALHRYRTQHRITDANRVQQQLANLDECIT
jgi:tetratricopeptide (TPR) repeat protein